MDYISLYGYIRNIPSDTSAWEHLLSVDRSTWPVEKNILNHAKFSRRKELGGKTGVLVGLDLPSAGGGTEAKVWLLTLGQLSESEEKHLRLIVKQLICGSLNGMRIRQSLLQPYIPRMGMLVFGRYSGWELEFRDCGAIPWWGLLLTVERRIEGIWGRRLWWEMPVEEGQADMEARWYCWVMCRGWAHYHCLSLPTRQHLQLNNREVGPSNAWCTELQSRTPARGPLYVPDTSNNREGPQAREPSKCLNG